MMALTKARRAGIALSIAGACPASFVTQMILFSHYMASRPTSSHDDFIYSLNNHGTRVYISSIESTGLAALFYLFVISLGLVIAIAPKQFNLPPQGKPRWMSYVSGSARWNFDETSRSLKAIGLSSIVIWLSLIMIAGPALVRLLVSEGIILHLG